MNVIIVGCGKVGFTLASSLVTENHNITLIDKNQDAINNALTSIDCMCVIGDGSMQSVLSEAKVEDADFLIACTNSDEVNILTCLFAKKNSKCRTIARIRNPEYSHEMDYFVKELDISLAINPELATAREISRMVRYPKSISSDSFFKGRLNLLKAPIPPDSKVIGHKLHEISKLCKSNILICAIERGDDVIIPTGNSTIEKDDNILFVADHNNVISFFENIGFSYKQLNSYMIIGASRVSYYLIDVLLKNKITNIKVIEKDLQRCEDLISKFPNVSIVRSDGTDKNILLQEGLGDVDVFVPLTGIDEENIILSLLAKNYSSAKIITKVNHLNFIDALKELNLGSIVNPERIAANIIVSYVRAASNASANNIETLYRLCNDRIEGVGFIIKKENRVTNIRLKDLKLKKDVLIAGIYRHGNVIRPNGNDTLNVGDSVVIISKDNILHDIEDILVE
ncbi:MAG: Trk system potassium transporter TrkA [Lachnospiraceae bacterium]|nr:Trk system potassium transporter TrkA [Lachnospiraceae bacterium]